MPAVLDGGVNQPPLPLAISMFLGTCLSYGFFLCMVLGAADWVPTPGDM
jgi:hypothetical protein